MAQTRANDDAPEEERRPIRGVGQPRRLRRSHAARPSCRRGPTARSTGSPWSGRTRRGCTRTNWSPAPGSIRQAPSWPSYRSGHATGPRRKPGTSIADGTGHKRSDRAEARGPPLSRPARRQLAQPRWPNRCGAGYENTAGRPGVHYHQLSPAEHQRILEKRVLPGLGPITPQEQPIAVYVVGQPGSGKSTATTEAMARRHPRRRTSPVTGSSSATRTTGIC